MKPLMKLTLRFLDREEDWDFITRINFNSYEDESLKLHVEGVRHGGGRVEKKTYSLQHPDNRLVSILFWKDSILK